MFFDCMHGLLQLASLNVQQPGSLHQKDPRIQLLVDFICANYQEYISLQQLANLVRLNPFLITRLFQRTVGVSVYDYLLIVRAEQEKLLLRKGLKTTGRSKRIGIL